MQVMRSLSVLVIFVFAALYADSCSLAFESLYSDLRASGVGDVVTVVIMERTLASNSSRLDTEKDTRFFTSGESSGALDVIEPFGLGANIGREHEGAGITERKGSIVGKMAAMVVGITGNGNLEIKGEREIVINDEKEILTLTGVVRPQDISTDNVVYSTDMANTQIQYKGKGLVTSGNKPGILTRILSLFF
jgi:flagellar L-ring protein precursor FlgH